MCHNLEATLSLPLKALFRFNGLNIKPELLFESGVAYLSQYNKLGTLRFAFTTTKKFTDTIELGTDTIVANLLLGLCINTMIHFFILRILEILSAARIQWVDIWFGNQII